MQCRQVERLLGLLVREGVHPAQYRCRVVQLRGQIDGACNLHLQCASPLLKPGQGAPVHCIAASQDLHLLQQDGHRRITGQVAPQLGPHSRFKLGACRAWVRARAATLRPLPSRQLPQPSKCQGGPSGVGGGRRVHGLGCGVVCCVHATSGAATFPGEQAWCVTLCSLPPPSQPASARARRRWRQRRDRCA